MEKIMEFLQNVNKTMRKIGFMQELCLTNDSFEITESEVVMKILFSLTLKIPKESFEDKSDGAISRAISQAMSQAISLDK